MDRRVFMKSGAMALATMGLNPTFLRKTVFAQDPARDDADLLLTEAHPDARARTAAERDVRALGDSLARPGSEPLRPEGRRWR